MLTRVLTNVGIRLIIFLHWRGSIIIDVDSMQQKLSLLGIKLYIISINTFFFVCFPEILYSF